jgi:hypothetical protein
MKQVCPSNSNQHESVKRVVLFNNLKQKYLRVNHIFIFFLLASIFLSVSCNSDSSKQEIDTYEQLESLPANVPEYAKFGLQSGVIEMESVTMGIKQHIVMYFDDWGRVVASDITMNFLGKKRMCGPLLMMG